MVEHWIERGKKFIYPQKYESWCKHINGMYNDELFSTNYGIFYAAMEELEKGRDAQEVCDFINSLDSLQFSKDLVLKTVLLFSKRGPEFYRRAKSPLLNSAEKYIKVIENENNEFKQELVR